MLEFIKMFGLGIVYTIFFPIIVLVFALYLVYAFCNYLVFEATNVVGFFLGYQFSTETELEKRLHEMKSEPEEVKNEEAPVLEVEEEKGSDIV